MVVEKPIELNMQRSQQLIDVCRQNNVKLAAIYNRRFVPALRKAFTEHKNDLVFMDFIIDPTANVFPMVAAGKGLTEMILAEDL